MSNPRELGTTNRTAVKALLLNCPGIFASEIAKRLDLSEMAVGRHIAAIRAEWGGARPKQARAAK